MLSIDYRGFGDSTGVPDEDGLVTDAYAAWNWLLEHGAEQENILVIGHSLGTGVASQLAKKLAAEGAKPRGITLFAPFSSLSRLIETYSLFGLPILQPLQNFALGRSKLTVIADPAETVKADCLETELLARVLRHEFDTLSAVQVCCFLF